MSALAGWIVEALIASTLLMALVLLVRGPVRRAFGPQAAYTLWLLPLLRLMLPPLPPLLLTGWREAAATPVSRAGETIAVFVASPVAAQAAPSSGLPASLGGLLSIIWAVGAAGFLLHHLVGHRRFCRRILAAAEQIDHRNGIRIVVSAAAPGPLAFGLWHRYVAFPLDVADRYDADERALALAHEIGHHQRGDLIANWIALAVLALHWFDPLAWRAFRAFRADQELANDALVLAGRPPSERHAYARAIVKAAHHGAVSAACHLHTIADLKGRLKMLSLSPVSRRRLASGATAIGALAVAGLGLTASGSSAAAISAGVRQAVGVPVTPPTPAPPMPPEVPAVPPTSSEPATNGHKISRVVIVKDGKTTVRDDFSSADIDAHVAAGDRIAIRPAVRGGSRMIVKMPDDPGTLVEVQDVPAVSSAKCGIGTGQPATMLVQNGKGPRRKIIICTDRIRQLTASAMATTSGGGPADRYATMSEAQAHKAAGINMRETLRRALASLEGSRAGLTSNDRIPEAERREAITNVDRAITELRLQIADIDQ